MTVAAGDAHEFPIYGARYRVLFPLFDATGALVTAPGSLDSEISKDQGAAADCTNEATEIASGTGGFYLDLTGTEMTCKGAMVFVKSTGAKTGVITLYPKRMPILRSGAAQAGAGSTITLDAGASAKDGAYVGCYVRCSNDSPANVQGQTRKIVSYVGSTRVATVEQAWGTNPSSATTFEILIPETVNAQAWLGKEIVDPTSNGVPEVRVQSVADNAITTAAITDGALTAAKIADNAITAAKVADGAIDAGAIADGAIDAATFAAGAITANAIADNAIGSNEIASDGAAKIADAVSAELGVASGNLDTQIAAIAGYIDTEVGAVKTQTDKLTFDGDNHIASNVKKISDSAAAADNLEGGTKAAVLGTCASGSTTTSVVTNLAEATDNHYNNASIVFYTGALAGQRASITDYDGTTKTLTVTTLTEAPANGDAFVIV